MDDRPHTRDSSPLVSIRGTIYYCRANVCALLVKIFLGTIRQGTTRATGESASYGRIELMMITSCISKPRNQISFTDSGKRVPRLYLKPRAKHTQNILLVEATNCVVAPRCFVHATVLCVLDFLGSILRRTKYHCFFTGYFSNLVR